MSSDSELEQSNSGNEGLANFEGEIEGLAGAVGAAVPYDDAQIDRLGLGRTCVGEPLADDEHCIR